MKLVDVTLRESVYTEYNITIQEGLDYLTQISRIEDIDYVEIGYINLVATNNKNLGLFNEDYVKQCKLIANKRPGLSAMLHLEQFSPSKWDEKTIMNLDMIRISINGSINGSIDDLYEAVEYFKRLKIIVSINFSYISRLTYSQFNTILSNLYSKKIIPDVFYIADSNGGLTPSEIVEYIRIIKMHYLDTKIGIHAHNHMGLALSNSLYVVSVDYVDVSINGFGKGGGNAKMESYILLKSIKNNCILNNDYLYKLFMVIKCFNETIIKTNKNYIEEYENLLYAYKNLQLNQIAVYKKIDIDYRIKAILNIGISPLEEIVNFAVNTVPFYRDRKNQYVRKYCDIPIINKQIYQNNVPPLNNNLLSNEIKSSYIFSTSGTTGRPQYIVRDVKDIDYQVNDYLGLNICEKDVVLNLFWPGIWGIYTTANITLTRIGATVIPLGGKDLKELSSKQLIDIILQFKVSVIIGVPSTIIAVTKIISENKKCLDSVRKIFCLGEKMTKQAYSFLKDLYPNVTIKTKYGCMETAGIGYQCEYISGSQYHIYKNRHVEVIDLDSNSHMPTECVGRIIVTTLDKRLIPLIRYDTGDLGCLKKYHCPCGEDVLLEIIGRRDKEIIIGSVHIDIDKVNAILKNNSVNYNGSQYIVETINAMDYLKVLVSAELINEQSIMENLLVMYPDLKGLLHESVINDISIVKTYDFITTSKSGKTPQIVDLRE